MRHAHPLPRRRQLAAGFAAAVVLLSTAACAESSSDGSDSPASDPTVSAPDGTFAGKKADGDPIKIGIINAEDGPAISQPEGRVAAEAVVKYANANLGGIGGHPIETVVCKSKEDAASASDCANQMVEAKVAGVVVLNTGQGDSMAPIITGAGIPYTGYNGSSGAELTGDPAFFWTGGFPGILTGMAKYSAEQGYKKFTLFVTDNASVVAGATAMGKPAFEAAGIDATFAPIPLGTPDATSQVTAGLKNDPDAIGIVGDSTMCSSTLKGLGTVGYKGDKLVITFCLDPSAVEAAGAVLDGSKLMTETDGTGTDDESLIYQAVMAKYAPGETLEGAAMTGFQSMLGFVRATEGLQGDPTAENLAAAIRTVKDISVPLAHGATMTCSGTVLPGLKALCSDYILVGDVDAKGNATNVEVLK